MRRYFFSLLVLLTAMAAGASPVSPGEALRIANDFFNKGVSATSAPRKARPAVQGQAQQPANRPYYIFNADDAGGFVIVAGDDRVPRILGYSDQGQFLPDRVPPQLQWLLDVYARQIEDLTADSRAPLRAAGTKAAAPLITTHWGQGAPYNAYCPEINGSKALTGCVATAMAQVVYYERISTHVEEIPEYWDRDGNNVEGIPACDFDFDNLGDDGIARLMRYCGQAVKMNYGLQESGASSEEIPMALRTYFGWDEKVRLMNRSDYNDEHWMRMVTEEIAAGHPLIYSGTTEQGAGHAFVVDGVADGLFHVNWGWEGNLDGYFSFQQFATDNRADYILMQSIVTLRDDDKSSDIITKGTTIGGINYELNDNLSATVLPLKNGEKYRGELTIPSHVEYQGVTYTVKYLGDRAFADCAHLEYISIPATIEEQAWSVFSGCVNLHRVNIEDMAAFIRLEVGGSGDGSPLYHGADLYLNGELVKDLVIPEGITEVGYAKFDHCRSIETVKMPRSMKKAGQYSFSECPNLRYVDMSESSVEVIDILAFNNDSALEEVILPATLKEMLDIAFGNANGPGCCNLRKIVCLATTPPWSVHNSAFHERHYGDAVLYVPDESVEAYRNAKEWCMFNDIRPLSQVRPIPERKSITSGLLNYEIYPDEGYAKVVGHENVDDLLFEGYFEGFVIPASVQCDGKVYPVEQVGFEALYAMPVKKIDAPLKKLSPSAFRWARFSDTLEIPSTITHIPYRAFAHADMPKLVIPASVSRISSQAFGDEEIENNMYIGEIECHSEVPPTIEHDTFGKYILDYTLLKVPAGAKKAYLADPLWSEFAHISVIGDNIVSIKGDYNFAYSGPKTHVSIWPVGAPEWPGVKMTEALGSDGMTYKVFKVPEDTTIYNISIINPGEPGDHDDYNDYVCHPYTSEYVMNDKGATSIKVVFGDIEIDDDKLRNDLFLTAHMRSDMVLAKNMPIQTKIAVHNFGSEKVPGFTLVWSVDGNKMGTRHYPVALEPGSAFKADEDLEIEVESSGRHELKLEVIIDGADDEAPEDNNVALSFDYIAGKFHRVSLIEQFTSENCAITPFRLPVLFSGIENSGYADMVADVGHHCGYYPDFLTVNTDYEWFYSPYPYTPAMMINRTDLSLQGSTPVFEIPEDVDRKIIAEAGLCDALVSVYCDVTDNTVQVKTLLEKSPDFDEADGYNYLTVYLLEDSIAPRDQQGTFGEFIHRNTLRKILTDTWGSRIEWRDGICAWKFETEIDPEWNRDNLKAVAFIHRYNPEDRNACQVYTAKSSVMPQYGTPIDDSQFVSTPSVLADPVVYPAGVYNLLGVRVKADASDLSGLAPGVYICNGRKILVK